MISVWSGLPSHMEETLDLAKPTSRRRCNCRKQPAEGLYSKPAQHRRNPPIPLGQRDANISFVSRETFIAAIAVERHLDMLPCELRHVITRYCRGVGERLAVMVNKRRQDINSAYTDDKFVVIRRESISNESRVRQLTKVGLIESYRKGLDAFIRKMAHQGHDET